jgi:hypothetical protein
MALFVGYVVTTPTTSSGDITVTVPGTTGEKPRVWTFPDALLHYAVDVGYMPPRSFLEDIKRTDIQVARDQTRDVGGESVSRPDKYGDKAGGVIGYLQQAAVNAERAQPWGGPEFAAFLANMKNNVLAKMPWAIEGLKNNEEALNARAELGVTNRSPLAPSSDIPVKVDVSGSSRIVTFTFVNPNEPSDWLEYIQPENLKASVKQETTGTTLTVQISNDEDEKRFMNAVTNIVEEFEFSYYYTADGTEMTRANMVGEMEKMLKAAVAISPARVRAKPDSGDAAKESPVQHSTTLEEHAMAGSRPQTPAARMRSELEKNELGRGIGGKALESSIVRR